jgi:hypothetical protein
MVESDREKLKGLLLNFTLVESGRHPSIQVLGPELAGAAVRDLKLNLGRMVKLIGDSEFLDLLTELERANPELKFNHSKAAFVL